MKHLIIAVFVAVAFTACTPSSTNSQATIDKEIKALTTNAAKKDYLAKILSIDQQFRTGQEEEVQKKEGLTSQAYKDFLANRTKLDRENYKKIDRYLAIHGHPKPMEVSLNLTSVPCTVIHHGGSYEEQASHFKTMHQAYKSGYFTNYIFMLYLNGMYDQKFDKRLKLESPYTEEDEISAIQKALGL